MKLGKPFRRRNIQGANITYHKSDIAEKYGAAGFWDAENNRIIVDKDMTGDELTQTILHEEFEAVFHRNRGPQLDISKDAKETIIDALSAFVVEHYEIKLRKKPISI